jgi:phosphohistidine phosphatase
MAEHVLILLRHAKSDWSVGHADIDRPLAPRGRRQAPQAGAWLAEHVDAIDLAVVSSAARARATWQLVGEALDPSPRTTISDEVYAASADELLAVVNDLPEEARTVVLVGHNPGLEDLTVLLTGEAVSLPTSAIAVVDVDGPWAAVGEARAVLRTSGRPPAT